MHYPSGQRADPPPQAGGAAAISLPDMTTLGHFARLAYAARLLSTPIRLNIFTSLLRGEASVSALAARLDRDRHRLSYHLALLQRHALVQPARNGRLIVYRVDARAIRPLLAALNRLRLKYPPRTVGTSVRGRPRTPGADLRQARACYDHLGGLAGVYLLEELLRRRWVLRRLEHGRPTYSMTTRGAQALMRRRVNVLWAGRRRRKFAYGCPDWSPGRLHLGGALGAVVFESLIRSGVVHPEGNARRVALLRPLASWLDGRVGRASR